jgi:hypothetical protein
MMSEIKIGIGNEGETAQEFVEVWRRTEGGKPPEMPMEHLYFPDLETLTADIDVAAPGLAQDPVRYRTDQYPCPCQGTGAQL